LGKQCHDAWSDASGLRGYWLSSYKDSQGLLRLQAYWQDYGWLKWCYLFMQNVVNTKQENMDV